MILTGTKIREEVESKKISISPFSSDKVTTNSYDLTLGKTLLRYTSNIIDPKIKSTYVEISIPPEGILMEKGDFLLGHSVEKIGSDFYVPIIHGKSGTARMGLFVHVTADLIDIGYYGETTFQLYATLPVRIYADMPIAQVSFWKSFGEIELYKGKYQNSSGPKPSVIHSDFTQDYIKKD